jgi:FkbM family methyltransferase
MNRLVRALQRRLLNYKRTGFTRDHGVGPHVIALPPGHLLDTYQEAFTHYDKPLPLMVALLAKRDPHLVVIDIGANVGDGLGAIRGWSHVKVVCVEGVQSYFDLLSANANRVGGDNVLIRCFVGAQRGTVDEDEVEVGRGTGRLRRIGDATKGNPPRGATEVLPLEDVALRTGIEDRRWFVKIDTDGGDFAIIRGNIDAIAKSADAIFFEYDPALAAESGVDAINDLLCVGFSHFLVFDNFGNAMALVATQHADRFRELELYLQSCRAGGGGAYYIDVLALRGEHSHLSQELFDKAILPNDALAELARPE